MPIEDIAPVEALDNESDLRAAARAKTEIAKHGVVRWAERLQAIAERGIGREFDTARDHGLSL